MTATYPMPANQPALRARHAGYVADQLRSLPIGLDFVVTIKRGVRDRSSRQNRYLHAIIGEIAKAVGMNAEDAKDALVMKFVGAESERVVGGVTITTRRSTAKLSTAECATFCDQLRAWAAEYLGLLLPLPEEFE